ncbi:hypothetical protein BESB_076290 [Besnoitia besnoiti]|uniref:Uncharacterized protein n=1 Tax=Besnoitia besnoiti TaxID=94643 RepID=A0A2A9MDG6_BESBE|nr:hypothetical protein BESB_076290 [Besnoitia besnoiti]PFH33412.1 hypothetical protein BESB_076290 [Besnoitia besnoiti]
MRWRGGRRRRETGELAAVESGERMQRDERKGGTRSRESVTGEGNVDRCGRAEDSGFPTRKEKEEREVEEARHALWTVERVREIIDTVADATRHEAAISGASSSLSEPSSRPLTNVCSRRLETLLLSHLKETFEGSSSPRSSRTPSSSFSSVSASSSVSSSSPSSFVPPSYYTSGSYIPPFSSASSSVASVWLQQTAEGGVRVSGEAASAKENSRRQLRALTQEEDADLRQFLCKGRGGELLLRLAPLASLSLPELAELALHARKNRAGLFLSQRSFWKSLAACTLRHLESAQARSHARSPAQVAREGGGEPRHEGRGARGDEGGSVSQTMCGAAEVAAGVEGREGGGDACVLPFQSAGTPTAALAQSGEEVAATLGSEESEKWPARPWIEVLLAFLQFPAASRDPRFFRLVLAHLRERTFFASLDDILHAAHLLAKLRGARWSAEQAAAPRESEREESAQLQAPKNGERRKRTARQAATEPRVRDGLSGDASLGAGRTGAAAASRLSERRSEKEDVRLLTAEAHRLLVALGRRSLLRRKELPLCVSAAVLHAHAVWQAEAIRGSTRLACFAVLPPLSPNADAELALKSQVTGDAGKTRGAESEIPRAAPTLELRQKASPHAEETICPAEKTGAGEQTENGRGSLEGSVRRRSEEDVAADSHEGEEEAQLQKRAETPAALRLSVFERGAAAQQSEKKDLAEKKEVASAFDGNAFADPLSSLLAFTPTLFHCIGEKAASQISLQNQIRDCRERDEGGKRGRPSRRKDDLRYTAVIFASFAKARCPVPPSLLEALDTRWSGEREGKAAGRARLRKGDEEDKGAEARGESRERCGLRRGEGRRRAFEDALSDEEEGASWRGQERARRRVEGARKDIRELRDASGHSVVLLLSALAQSEEGRRSAAFAVLSRAMKTLAPQLNAQQLAMGMHALSLGRPPGASKTPNGLLARFLFDRGRLHKLSGSHLRLVLVALVRSPPPRGGVSPAVVDAVAQFVEASRTPHKIPLDCLTEALRFHGTFGVFHAAFLAQLWKGLQRRGEEIESLASVARSLHSLARLPRDLTLAPQEGSFPAAAERLPAHPVVSAEASAFFDSSPSPAVASSGRRAPASPDSRDASTASFLSSSSPSSPRLSAYSSALFLDAAAKDREALAEFAVAREAVAVFLQSRAAKIISQLASLALASGPPFGRAPSSSFPSAAVSSALFGPRDASARPADGSSLSLSSEFAAPRLGAWRHVPRELGDLLQTLTELLPSEAAFHDRQTRLVFATQANRADKASIQFVLSPPLVFLFFQSLSTFLREPRALAFFAFDSANLERVWGISLHLLSRLAAQNAPSSRSDTTEDSGRARSLHVGRLPSSSSSASSSSSSFSSSPSANASEPSLSCSGAVAEAAASLLRVYLASSTAPSPLSSPSDSRVCLASAPLARLRLLPILLSRASSPSSSSSSSSSPALSTPVASAAAALPSLACRLASPSSASAEHRSRPALDEPRAAPSRSRGEEDTGQGNAALRQLRRGTEALLRTPRARSEREGSEAAPTTASAPASLHEAVKQVLTLARTGCHSPFVVLEAPSSSIFSSLSSPPSCPSSPSSSVPSSSASPLSEPSVSAHIAHALASRERQVLFEAYASALPALVAALAQPPAGAELSETAKAEDKGKEKEKAATALGRRGRKRGARQGRDLDAELSRENAHANDAPPAQRQGGSYAGLSKDRLGFPALLELLTGVLALSLRRLLARPQCLLPEAERERSRELHAGGNVGDPLGAEDRSGKAARLRREGEKDAALQQTEASGRLGVRPKTAEAANAEVENALEEERRGAAGAEAKGEDDADTEREALCRLLCALQTTKLSGEDEERAAPLAALLSLVLNGLQFLQPDLWAFFRPSLTRHLRVLQKLSREEGTALAFPSPASSVLAPPRSLPLLLSTPRVDVLSPAFFAPALVGGAACASPFPGLLPASVGGDRTAESRPLPRKQSAPALGGAAAPHLERLGGPLTRQSLHAESERAATAGEGKDAPAACERDAAAERNARERDERQRKKDARRWALPSAIQTGKTRDEPTGFSLSFRTEGGDGTPDACRRAEARGSSTRVSLRDSGRTSWEIRWTRERSVAESVAAADVLFDAFERLSVRQNASSKLSEGKVGIAPSPLAPNTGSESREKRPCSYRRNASDQAGEPEARGGCAHRLAVAAPIPFTVELAPAGDAYSAFVEVCSWRRVYAGGRPMLRVDMRVNQTSEETRHILLKRPTKARGERLRIYFFFLSPIDFFHLPLLRLASASACGASPPASSAAARSSAAHESGDTPSQVEFLSEPRADGGPSGIREFSCSASLVHPRVYLELYVADSVLTNRSARAAGSRSSNDLSDSPSRVVPVSTRGLRSWLQGDEGGIQAFLSSALRRCTRAKDAHSAACRETRVLPDSSM